MRLIINLFSKLLTPAAHKFHHALKNPQASQQAIQKDIFQRLLKSEYGKSLNIKSVADWHHIPIVAYHDMEKWILQQKENNQPILTSENILFYEKTSGSRGKAKLIPYTLTAKFTARMKLKSAVFMRLFYHKRGDCIVIE